MKSLRTLRWMPLAILALSLVAAWFQALHRHRQNLDRVERGGAALSDDVVRWIEVTLGRYEYGLNGARGAVVSAGGPAVRWDRFADYADTRDLPREFPGSRGYGFVRRVSEVEESAYLARQRDDGRPAFALRQLNAHAGERFVVEFVEPLRNNQAALGLDMASEGNRRAAALASMRSGGPVITAPVTLMQARDRIDRGFVLFLPVVEPGVRPATEDERLRSTFGWVFSPVLIDEMLTHAPWMDDRFHLALSDVTDPGAPVRFWGHAELDRHDGHPFTVERRLRIFGRVWTAHLALTPRFVSSLNLRHPAADAAWIGTAGALLALLLHLFLRHRERERRDFVQRAWLAAIVEGADSAIVGCGLDGCITSWNPAAVRLFGIAAEQAQGHDLSVLVGAPELANAIGHGGVTRCRRRDGSTLDVWVSESPVLGVDGRRVGTAWTLRDVTRQRAVEHTVHELMKLGSALEGEDFVDRATEALCGVLRAAHVFVARVESHDDAQSIRVISGWGRDGRLEKWEMGLAGTPCELLYQERARAPTDRVEADGSVVIAQGLQARFEAVRDTTLEAFIGLPLRDRAGSVVGHLGVGFSRRLEAAEIGDLLEVSRLFGHRLQAELQRDDAAAQRDRAIEQLHALNRSLESEAASRKAAFQRISDIQKALLENAGYAIMATDAEGRVALFNAAAEAMLGYRAEDVMGRGLEIFHDTAEMIRRSRELGQELGRGIELGLACFSAKADRGLRDEREWTYVRKDGSRFPALLNISALRDGGGASVGYLCIAVDLSERRRLEQALTAERDRFRTTLNVAPSAILTVNRQGLIEHASARVENVFGYTPEQVEGRPVEMLMELPQRETHGHLRETYFMGQSGARLMSGRSVMGLHRDGRRVPIEVRLSLFESTDGPKVIAIATDRSAQEVLAESEQRWRNMANYLPQLVWTCTAEGACDFVSRQWVEYTGLPESDQLVDGWANQVHPEDRDRMVMAWKRAVQSVGSFQDEYRIRRHDGVYRWFDTRAVPLRDEQGRVLKWIGANTDIEDRKAAERQVRDINASLERRIEERTRALEESRRDLRNTLDSMPNIVCYWDRNLYSRFANKAYRYWFGVDPAAGRMHYDATLPPHLAERNRPIVEAALRGEIQRFERDIPSPEGVMHSFDVLYLPDIVDGVVQGFYSISSDVTEVRRAKEMAEAARRNLQNILDAIPSMVGYWDRDLRNRFANEAYRSWFGLDPKSLPGKHMSEVFGPTLYQASEADVAAALAGERRTFEREIRSQDGDVRIAMATYLPDVVDGEVRGFYALSHDITDVRRAQAAAEAASAAKSTFLANMSHEIRTPLNGVLGMLELLVRSRLEPAQRDFVDKASAAARTLLGILNDILDFSKIEAGKLELDPQPFAFDDVLSEIGVLLAASRGDRPIEIVFDIAPDVPRDLKGDALRLKQILINLAGNALKFTTQGEVVLGVEVLRATAEHVDLQFSVRDTGIGMSAEQCRRVFDGFVQAEASTTRRFGGTGLGLAISQRLTVMMGGELHVQSTLGAGSTFQFVLPFARAVRTVGEAPAATPSTDRLRILLIEDHPRAREVMVKQMRGVGWTVLDRPSLDAESARSLTADIDAAVVDWPPADESAAAALHQLQSRCGLRIIGVASDLSQARVDAVPGSPLRLSAVLSKPVVASTLVEAVIAACRPQGDAAPAQGTQAAPISLAARFAPRLQGLRILVVEDNPTNQLVAQGLLSGEGARVTIAGGGLAGVTAVAEARPPFDVVLMDLQMPDIDGFEATARIRRLPGAASLPIIAMTANAMQSDRDDCLRSGMNEHVAKPIDVSRLVFVIQRCLGRVVEDPTTPSTGPQGEAGWVDVAGAVERMGGDHSIYAEVLRSMLEDLPSLHAQITQSDHAASARARAAHTLKGLAGTVGAERLKAAALRVEQEFKQAGNWSDGARNSFEACLAQTASALRRVSEQLADDAASVR